jgi:FkbM family methyltransferase
MRASSGFTAECKILTHSGEPIPLYSATAISRKMLPNNNLAPARLSPLRSLFETHGPTAAGSLKIYCNKIAYALAKQASRPPANGWIHSRWHWHRFPFSLRNSILWSGFLDAWFSPADESALECMLRLPYYEPVNWVTPQPEAVFLDIGAYVGSYAILAAKSPGFTGRIIALEPDQKNRQQLERNLKLNAIANCTVVPCAAWSHSGKIGWHEGETPVWHRAGSEGCTETVEAVTVDGLVAEHALNRVDWIKMDIEGGEVEALKGAEKTLREFRPALFIEIHATASAVRDLLAPLGYRIDAEFFDEPPDHHGWFLARSR